MKLKSLWAVALSQLVSLLKSMDAAIPEGEGCISLRLFADTSGRFDLEMWGNTVASGQLGEPLVTDRGLVIGVNPDWLPDVESLVARFNSILANVREHPLARKFQRRNQMTDTSNLDNAADSGLPATTCYALRLYNYDYYERQEDFAVSFDQELLKAHFAGLDHLYDDRPLVDVSEHESHAENEEVHWGITPILFLHNVQEHPTEEAK